MVKADPSSSQSLRHATCNIYIQSYIYHAVVRCSPWSLSSFVWGFLPQITYSSIKMVRKFRCDSLLDDLLPQTPNSHPLRHLGAGPQRKLIQLFSVESAGKRSEGNLNYSILFPEILLVPVRLFCPSFKYHPVLTMMARFYGARLVKISSLEFVEHIWSLPYCTNTFPLKRKQCTTPISEISSEVLC